ncbi:MFS transporter [Cumulibacter manganitolerans]|uniref:MFS transporter n=1 Tax=Cumulibacter manganitolerans TaxID=1884992 RepID=UPI001296782D|nr:MFS transporter [Cumulibacter manganitolerans]
MSSAVESIATTSRATARNVVAIASAAMFIGGLNMSIVNIALPAISADIHATAAQSSWILLANLLASNALMVVFGKLADLTSRRVLFIGGIVVFALGSVLSAVATEGWVLIAGRAISGIGAAMMFATTSALIALAVPRARIGQAMGIYFACNSAAQLLGPVIGGIVVDTIGWPWLFWMNLPICLVLLVASYVTLGREANHNARSFDVSGGLLFVALVTTLVAMLTSISSRGLDPLVIGASLGCFAVLVPLFVWRESRAGDPMVELSVLRDRLFVGTTFTTFLSHIARFGILILLALVYQSAYGLSATRTSLLVLPIAVGSLIAAPIAGSLEIRRGSAWVSLAGTVVVLVSVLLCAVMIWRPSWYWIVGLGGAGAGAGGGMVLTANSSAVTKATPVEKLGVVGSLRVMVQGTGIIAGTALALASVSLLLPPEGKSAVYAAHDALLPEAFRDGLLDGLPIAFGVIGVAALGSVVLSRIAYRGYERL